MPLRAASSPRRPPRCPSIVGGERNWDYRFCWLRDATFTLLGCCSRLHDEARSGAMAVARDCRGPGRPSDHVRHRAANDAWTSTSWNGSGLRGLPSGPGRQCRREQLQLDVYGELLDAAYQTQAHGVPGDPAAWALPVRCSAGWSGTGARRTQGSGRYAGRPPLHALQGDGLGGVRPGVRFRDSSAVGAGGALAHDARRDPKPGARPGVEPEQQAFVQSYGSDQLDGARC